jgi:hypothetical protein
MKSWEAAAAVMTGQVLSVERSSMITQAAGGEVWEAMDATTLGSVPASLCAGVTMA